MTPMAIVGLGTAVPKHAMTQQEAAALAARLCAGTKAQRRLLPVLYRKTQVQRRGSVLIDSMNGSGVEQEFFQAGSRAADRGPTTAERMDRYAHDALPLAQDASRAALEEAGLPAAAVTHLVTVSCTGFIAPGVDLMLSRALGLAPTVERTHIGFMGCHGALNGLRVASAFGCAHPQARILLCAVELCSLHFHYGWHPDRLVANALFADGAAAAVLAPQSRGAWRVAATGSCVFPDSTEAMTWRIGDHGFEMTLSARVPALITAHLRPWLEQWLAQAGRSVSQVRSWAIHPGGPRVLESVASCLSLPADAVAVSREVLAAHGNMSSPTVLFILQQLRARQAPRPCVLMGFGPGLAVEAALLI